MMVTCIRLLVATALAAGFAVPAAARDTWYYQGDLNSLKSLKKSEYFIALDCLMGDRGDVNFGIVLEGSKYASIVDKELRPDGVPLPISLTVAIDGEAAEEYFGKEILLTATGAKTFFHGKETTYRLAKQLGAARSEIVLGMILGGHPFWKRAVGASGAAASSQRWVSECDRKINGS